MEHNRISLIYYICDAMRASTESGTLNKNSVENNSSVEYSKISRYDEYTSLVMRWSNSAGTKAGDTKIFYKNSGDYRLLEADGNGGYVEIARGTYKKVVRFMEDYLEKMIGAFVGILKNLGFSKEEVMGIGAFVGENEQMMTEIVDRLEEKQFKVTTQEAMNIIAQVIKETR